MDRGSTVWVGIMSSFPRSSLTCPRSHSKLETEAELGSYDLIRLAPGPQVVAYNTVSEGQGLIVGWGPLSTPLKCNS